MSILSCHKWLYKAWSNDETRLWGLAEAQAGHWDVKKKWKAVSSFWSSQKSSWCDTYTLYKDLSSVADVFLLACLLAGVLLSFSIALHLREWSQCLQCLKTQYERYAWEKTYFIIYLYIITCVLHGQNQSTLYLTGGKGREGRELTTPSCQWSAKENWIP